MEMSKSYEPEEVEEKWQEKWREWEIHKYDHDSEKPNFSIDTPPRYASGDLHMGHAKNYLEFEMIARAKRLLGYNVFFPVGYDDNGLPTERYVEEELGIDKDEVGKEKFVEKCKESAKELEDQMTEIFERIGMSWDWDTFYRTIDEKAMEIAQKSFIELYDQGEVYRKDEPTLWCPYHETSLAQATVEDKERHTILNYLYFETQDGEKVEIATTRPELLPSCVAVFVHPDDERYDDLVGTKCKVPLFDYEVPVLESEEVDPEFGSGIVMVCTFGDSTDVEMWKEHDLPLRISINEKGKMNENAGKYEGMTIKESREQIISDLEEKGIIFDKEDLQQSVGVCWRCETPVEFIPTKQWFINALDHKDELIEKGEEVNWYPEYYENRYRDWVENLKWDWCISRQRSYGIPFPVWHCEECENVIIPSEEDLPVDPRTDQEGPDSCSECDSGQVKPEEDVMDTWMTSSLTPQITTLWGIDEEFFQEMFPMSLRPQSHDIIRTWAFYTILKSYLHHDEIPWEDAMISGYVYSEEGVGMSASKGTGVSPVNIIEEHGTDVLRYWSAGAGTGEDIVYQEKDVVRGNKVLRKIWNASRFVGMHIEDFDPSEKPELETIDEWILTKVDEVNEECREFYENYEVSKVRRKIEDFFKNIFCDNYLEMVKHRLYESEKYGEESRKAAQYALYNGLLTCLKIFAPIIPHITEEIYQKLFREKEDEKSLQLTEWTEFEDNVLSEESLELGELAKEFVEKVRRWKSNNGISLGDDLKKVVIDQDSTDKDGLQKMESLVKGAINIENIEFSKIDDSEEQIELENADIEIAEIIHEN